ncbi:MAG TPA: pyruvate formate lyase family protein, partial [Spirochaetia bacterium]|nr:pyruvate formate lyase family protein [Spirochaetia bacterium]
MTAWRTFTPGSGASDDWTKRVNVRDFLQKNYTPYTGNSDFLTGPTDRTRQLWEKLSLLLAEERKKGVLDASADRPSSITAHGPGYIDKTLETIVGLQTDAPL